MTKFIISHIVLVLVFSTALIGLPYAARGIDRLRIETVFAPSLQAYGIILLILASTAKPDFLPFPFRPLNTGTIVWLGVISYSLYLWHSLFTSDLLSNLGLSQDLLIFISISVAAASYHLLESPLLRLRKSYRS